MTTLHLHLSDTLLHHRPTNNSTLLFATLWIINHIYAGYTNSLTFSLWSRTAADDIYQTELLSEFLAHVSGSELTYVIENSEDVQCGKIVNELVDFDTNQCLLREDVILMVDSFEAFMHFKGQFEERNFVVAGFFTILYTGQEQPFYDLIARILEELFAIYVTNVIIFVERSQETLVYTYFPFTQYHCSSAAIVLHNRFLSGYGFIFPKPFFPAKTENFYGCEMTVATWEGPPFMIFKKLPQGNIFLRGIEGTLIRVLAERMNFTIKLLDTSYRGIVLPNRTASSGAVQMVIDGTANITINSYVYSKYQLRSMLASYPYLSYPIIIAVPEGQALSSFQRLMRPFKYIIWSCLSSSVMAGIIMIFAIKCLQNKTVSDFVFGPTNRTPATNLINVLLGGQVTTVPRRNFARYLLLVWLIYTFVLRAAYTGELFFMLQDATSRSMLKSINELVRKNFTIFCTENTIEILLESTRIRRMELMRGGPFEYLAKLHNSDSKMAVVTVRPFLRFYNHMVRGKTPIGTLPQDLETVQVTMYFRRNSYLGEVVNEHLAAFKAAGLIEIFNRFFLPNEDVMTAEVKKEPVVLSVQLLMGLFSVYLFLMGFGILVFGLEMWSRNSPICKSVLDFFNY